MVTNHCVLAELLHRLRSPTQRVSYGMLLLKLFAQPMNDIERFRTSQEPLFHTSRELVKYGICLVQRNHGK